MNIAILLVVGLVIILLILRKKSVPEPAKPDPSKNWDELLSTHVDYYRALGNEEKQRFEQAVHNFLRDVSIEGIGTEITDIDRTLIASSAVIPVFGFPHWQYKNLSNVILYPDTFDEKFQFEGNNRNIMGMVGTGYMNGQMILSRAALIHGFSRNNGKQNTAIHEFVHLLDKADGETDGLPELFIPHEYAEPWLQMMHREMQRIEKGKSDINPYATTNEAEFLAVTSEYFFEKPDQFQHKHPELYEQLSRIFGQDLAEGTEDAIPG